MRAEAWADHAHAIERCVPVAKVRRPETPYCMRVSKVCTVHIMCTCTVLYRDAYGFPTDDQTRIE